MRRIDRNSLIVSCQALEDEPLYGSEIMVRMALAAKMGGAQGIRANTPKDIQAIRAQVDLPIIGLWKKDYPGYEVYITPTYEEVRAVFEAGADYVAIDCTRRARPEELNQLFVQIRQEFPDRGIVADLATKEDAKAILELQPDFLATTLSGYTQESMDRSRPDLELVQELAELSEIPVIAEGNYKNGMQAAQALQMGAHAVVIGGAITRPQSITETIRLDMVQNL